MANGKSIPRDRDKNGSLKDSMPQMGAWSPLTFEGKGGRGSPFPPQRAAGPQRAVSKNENKKVIY